VVTQEDIDNLVRRASSKTKYDGVASDEEAAIEMQNKV
jgi:hypothetical protein